MIKQAKQLIENILRAQNVKQVFLEESGFERIKVNPSVIILAEKEKLAENRRKVAKWTDESTGRRYLRWQKYDRILPISANIFHQSEEKVDEIVRLLLAQLPKGMDDGQGNWVEIVPSGIEWPPDQKERSLAVVFVQFIGGIYWDESLDSFTDVSVQLGGGTGGQG